MCETPVSCVTRQRGVLIPFSGGSRISQTEGGGGGTPEIGAKAYYYRPQRSWGKVIFSQASVILSRGGVCACWDTPSGPDQAGTPHGPGRHPHRDQGTLWTRQAPTPRPMQSILGDTVNERAVCILLECILIWQNFCRRLWKWKKLNREGARP